MFIQQMDRALHNDSWQPFGFYTCCVYILGNPLLCDCELRWYHQWIEEEVALAHSSDNIQIIMGAKLPDI